MTSVRVVVNFKYVFKAKANQFFRKSMYLYGVASFLIAYVNPLQGKTVLISSSIYFLMLCGFIFLLYIILALVQSATINFDADFYFSINENKQECNPYEAINDVEWVFINASNSNK